MNMTDTSIRPLLEMLEARLARLEVSYLGTKPSKSFASVLVGHNQKKCQHGRREYVCKVCKKTGQGGKGICIHDKQRSNCKKCKAARAALVGGAGAAEEDSLARDLERDEVDAEERVQHHDWDVLNDFDSDKEPARVPGRETEWDDILGRGEGEDLPSTFYKALRED